ncbi:MAG: hypothetical protein ABH859_03010 [Pseudomonadota bacterium]
MKIINSKIGKYFRTITMVTILPLCIVAVSNCGGGAGSGGGTTGSSPISLPAPTAGYITVTSPDASGKSLVYGYIYANNLPVGNATVKVTNTTAAAQANLAGKSLKAAGETLVTTTTDTTGYFSTSINANLNDTITVTYIDPGTGEESEAYSTTVNSNNQVLSSSSTMIPQDVAMDWDNGLAVIVANDGTNSEIIEINMATGLVYQRASFAGVLFDRIAVHSSFDHAAILDTTNDTLHWYDLAALADNIAATSSDAFEIDIHDVAIAELADVPLTTADFVAVAHDFETENFGFLDIYEINSGAPYSLNDPTRSNCLPTPDDEDYPNCSLTSDPMPVRATKLDIIQTTLNYAKMVLFAEYAGGERVVHFAHFRSFIGAPLISFELRDPDSTLFPRSGDLDPEISPFDLSWYNDDLALMTDNNGTDLIMLAETNTTLGPRIEATGLEVGTAPQGIATNPAGNEIYIADNSANSIVNVDMITSSLTTTSYTANVAPTQIVYYPTTTGGILGVIVTNPVPIFKTINITE